MGTFAGKYHDLCFFCISVIFFFNILFILEVNCLLISKTIPIPQNDFFLLGVGEHFSNFFIMKHFKHTIQK